VGGTSKSKITKGRFFGDLPGTVKKKEERSTTKGGG